MATQTRTFHLRLPKGAHEDVLDAWGALSGRAMRTLHSQVRKAEAAHRGDADPDGLRQAKNNIKSEMIKDHGITGRQYNGIEAQLKGIVESRRACAALDVERLTDKLSAKMQQLTAITKKLADDTKARADHAVAVAKHQTNTAAKTTSARAAPAPHKPPPLPTKAQASKMLDDARHQKLLFEAEGKQTSIASLTAKLETAKDIASGRVDPSIVFGSKSLLQARNLIHPHDTQSLTSWRKAWDGSRSSGFMLMGGKDEAAGNKSCKMLLEVATPSTELSPSPSTTSSPPPSAEPPTARSLDGVEETTPTTAHPIKPKGVSTPLVALHLRLPGALVASEEEDSTSLVGKHLTITGIPLPAFGRGTLLDAIRRNAGPVAHRPKEGPDSGLAFTYRFVRDAGFKHKTLSAWRVCITVEEALSEIQAGMAQSSGAKKPHAQRDVLLPEIDVYLPANKAMGPRLGVDVNADRLALALISADGNILKTWTLPLCLRGLSSGQREAKIGDVAKAVVSIAVGHNARLVLESLDFSAKKREMAQEAARSLSEAAYRRMLSSLAYAAIANAITRRAQRHGVSVGLVNPAYTSLIGEINWMHRVGHKALTRHEAAACAIARRDAGLSERINGIHGRRGRRTTVPAPEEARRHVWRQWSRVHRERLAAAKATRKASAHPSGRGEGRRAVHAKTNPGPVGGASLPVALGAT